MEIQYTASVFVIEDDKLLLMYNKKLDKWLQPGGHVENLELPYNAASRECLEETGIKVLIINDTSFLHPIPFAKENYINKVGNMIDWQYYGIPINTELENNERNTTGWFSLDEMIQMGVGEDIICKFKIVNEKLKQFKLTKIKEEVL